MWRVSRGASEVWLFGMVQPLPEGLDWNSTRLQRAIHGARQVFTQPRASAGLLGGIWFFLTSRDAIYLPGDEHVEEVLPPDLRARFIAARTEAGRDADHYEDYRLPIAALMVESDVLKKRGFAQNGFEKRLKAIARDEGVGVTSIADYDALKMMEELPRLTPQQNFTCVGDALDDIDQLKASARPSADAWADGDVPRLLSVYKQSRFDRCLQSVASARALWERAVHDTDAKVMESLGSPGKVVMVIGIDALLRKGGLLDRLRARGLTVEDPAP